ncbi:MAG TPA: isochorismatase family protein [Methanospirillum sp.]|nr:isochorismatase family protein [Methanospirillum sp.]
MKIIKILHIGDMQNGFTQKNGNLYVKGAQDIISPTNVFLNQVCDRVFDHTFIILDTHFAEEYHQSEEGKIFPIHCEYGTTDWELSVEVSGLPNKQYLTKNQFNMWGEKSVQDILFTTPQRKMAYDMLFHVVDDPNAPTRHMPRDECIRAISSGYNGATIEVTMIGVASDFCIRYAVEGWLVRGARVTIIHDLTKGIEKETFQVLEEERYHQYASDRLRAVTSTEFLASLHRR